MEFILSATSEDLTMDAADFDAQLQQATEALDGSTPGGEGGGA